MSVQKLIECKITALHLIACNKAPLCKNNRGTVCLEHGKRISAQNIFAQDKPYRFPALFVCLGFGIGGIFLIPDAKQTLAAFLCVILQNVNSVQAGHCQYRVPFIVKGAFPITTFYHSQLAIKNFRKKIPIAAGWLQKAAFNSFCFLLYKIAHGFYFTLGSKYLAVIRHTLP